MSQFTDALDQHLTEAGLSRNELARRIGVTSSAVSLWMTGKSQPTRSNVERIEDELAVDPRGSLLRAAGYASDTDDRPTVESLLRADPGIDPEDKRVILRIIRMARERFGAEAK